VVSSDGREATKAMPSFCRAQDPRIAYYAKLTEKMFSGGMIKCLRGRSGNMKKNYPHRGGLIFLPLIFWVATMLGCAGQKTLPPQSAPELLPITAEVTGVERLNDIAPKTPFQKTDTLVFRVNFRLVNPNPAPAKVEDLYFEAKVEDGTPDRTIVVTASMPGGFIPARGEMTWSCTEPYIYGGVLGSYMLRGVGGAEGTKGAAQKLEELWKDLGADKRKFFIEGKIASSLPEFPTLGIAHRRFNTEFTIPIL
jgi:hypothetical protein